MSFPRYPAYKDSGVQWIAALPSHWDLRRFKSIFAERIDKSESGDELLLSVSAYTGVTPRSELVDDGDHLSRAESLEGYKRCFKDDLVMNIMLAWNRGLAFTQFEGIVSPAYCVFKVIDGSHPKFLNYLVRSDEYTAYFKAFSSGVIDSRLRIYPETFGALLCALPATAEQAGIASFLDHETAKIDALVAEQERLIKLLKEKRQAVISHAVTKGLDPSEPMKDSGVEWLGEVPSHWHVGRVKQFFATTSGSTPQTDRQDIYYNGEIPWIRSLDLTDGEITEWEIGITPAAIEDTACKVLPIGTILVAMYGGDGTIGKNGLLRVTAATNQAICAILPSPQFDPAFVLAFMQHQRPYWMVGAEGTRKDPNISQDRVRNAVVLCPPLAEQEAISEHLRKAVSAFSSLEKEADTAIRLLLERRTTLISAAVTGQIDVRDWVPAETAH